MRMYHVLLVTLTILSSSQAFATASTYNLTVEDKSFDITYSFDGDLLAMDVDKESTSLLVGIVNTKDSEFELTFPSEVLFAENDEFIVLVDGLETDYAVNHIEGKTAITFPIIADSEEIEIIGTSVIPEFPFGALATLGLVGIGMLTLMQKHKLFKL